MPGYIVQQGATVLCSHGGQAQPVITSPRVKVDGQQVAVQSSQYSISGCPYPPNSGGPCVTAQWTSVATRVKAGGEPVVLLDSQATCTPTGVPLNIAVTQMRVKGQ